MAGQQREKPSCLIVCSANSRGVSAQSFINAFTLTSSTFNVFLATPEGKPVDFVEVTDDNMRQWIADFTSKPISMPHRLENIDSSRFTALLLPSSPGAPFDLSTNHYLSALLNSFIRERKPLCAVGLGVSGLFATLDRQTQEWTFSSYSLTGPSTLELAKREDFPTQPYIPADFVRKHGGTFSNSKPNGNYIVVDDHLITGQNSLSTLTAVQNLILLSNARLTKQR